MAKELTVWEQLPCEKQYIINLYENLNTFYTSYTKNLYTTNKNAVASDLKDIGCICADLMEMCKLCIKGLGLEGQF